MSNSGSGETLQDVVDRLEWEASELRRSRKRLVEAADIDRRTIERALHDGVQQYLVALAVDLRRLAGLIDVDPGAAKSLLDEIAAYLREALTDATDLAQKVYPPLLDGRGLAAALRAAADTAGITILVDIPAGANYPPEINAAVYWSCAEALSTASPGTQATVSVRGVGDTVTFEIAVAGHHPVGRLDRIRDRIEALEGSLSVDEGQEVGSRVHGWLPLSR